MSFLGRVDSTLNGDGFLWSGCFVIFCESNGVRISCGLESLNMMRVNQFYRL